MPATEAIQPNTAQRQRAALKRPGHLCQLAFAVALCSASLAVAQSTNTARWTVPNTPTPYPEGPYPCQNGQPTVAVPRMVGTTKLAVGRAHFLARGAACNWRILDIYEWGGASGTFASNYVCAQALQPWGQPTSDCIIAFPVQVVDVDHAAKPNLCSPHTPKPVYPLFGVERMQIDLGASLAGYALTWTYNTARKVPTSTPESDPMVQEPPMFGETGFGSLHRRLLYNPFSKSVRVTRGNGDTVSFTPGPGGTFVASVDSADRLTREGTGYKFKDATASALEYFDSEGRLTSVHRLDGRRLVFTYSTTGTDSSIAPYPGYLVTAQDAFGRVASFEYLLAPGAAAATDARVKAITLPGGRVTLEYTGGNLAAIAWPDSSVRRFRYERPELPWALTSIVDENGFFHAGIGYDALGRATASWLAGAVDRHVVSYSQPPQIDLVETFDESTSLVTRTRSWRAPSGTSVTLPNGSVSALGAAPLNGTTRLLSQSQPAGSGCTASTRLQSYDANGNIAARDDFNGTRVCYSNDLARNLETARVEGVSGGASCGVVAVGSALPAGARKVSTQWHPDWQLRARVAEPGRVTVYVYNGQPDPYAGGALASCAPVNALLPDGKPIAVLCRKVEQATTDIDGSVGFSAAAQMNVMLRDERWTYNAWGQVLSHDGPRADVADITLYEYYADTSFSGSGSSSVGHTKGDLLKVTNPSGHVTSYPAYNSAGQMLQSVDPNGVVNSQTYDARGRVTSKTTAGQTTVYQLWPTGLIQRITQPDGSWTYFEHDDAHRLWRISDNLGNSVSYTLDAMGNRTGESVVDPFGTLRRYVARGIDALGRVEQVTGRE